MFTGGCFERGILFFCLKRGRIGICDSTMMEKMQSGNKEMKQGDCENMVLVLE